MRLLSPRVLAHSREGIGLLYWIPVHCARPKEAKDRGEKMQMIGAPLLRGHVFEACARPVCDGAEVDLVDNAVNRGDLGQMPDVFLRPVLRHDSGSLHNLSVPS